MMLNYLCSTVSSICNRAQYAVVCSHNTVVFFMAKSKKDIREIEILTFLDPHVFYFTETKRIEERFELEKLLKCVDGIVLVRAEENLMVLVNDDGFKRAIVTHVEELHKTANGKKCRQTNKALRYTCWLVDYGAAITTEVVYDSPSQIANIEPFSKRACLYNAVPTETKSKFLLTKNVYKKLNWFNPDVVHFVRDIIVSSIKTTFKIINEFNDVLIGTITFTKNDNKTILDLVDELVKMGTAQKDKIKFQRLVPTTTAISVNDMAKLYKDVDDMMFGALSAIKLLNHNKINLMYENKLSLMPDVINHQFVQVQPTWASLQFNDDGNFVHFVAIYTTYFVVRHVKYKNPARKLFYEMDKYLEKQEANGDRPSVDLQINCCYLLQDELTGIVSRALLEFIAGDKCRVLLVDYGCKQIADIRDLQHIKEEFITKLPFQAIECRFYGVKPRRPTWGIPTRRYLIDNTFQPGTNKHHFFIADVIDVENGEMSPQEMKRYVIALLNNFDGVDLIVNRSLYTRFGEMKSDYEDIDVDYERTLIMEEDRKMLERFKKLDAKQTEPEILEPLTELDHMDGPWKSKGYHSAEVLDYLLNHMIMVYEYFDMEWSEDDNYVKIAIFRPDIPIEPEIRLACNVILDVRLIKNLKRFKSTLHLHARVHQMFLFKIMNNKIILKLKKMEKGISWPKLLQPHRPMKFIRAVKDVSCND